MQRPTQAKYIAPTIHALLFLAMWILYGSFDQPLLDGPAALPFAILFLADLPFSAFAFGVMFTSESNGPIAFALWGVIGTVWWHLLGRAIDARRHRIRGDSAESDTFVDRSEHHPSAAPARYSPLRLNGKSWLVSGGAVIVLVIVALATSWNGPKGKFQEGVIGDLAISPDGHSLLLSRTISNNTFLYRVSLDTGAAVRLTQATTGIESSPSFAPDGKQIAFVYQQSAGGHSRIFIVNANGNNLHSLFDTAAGNDTAPHFTPDRAHVQFARIAEGITPDPPGPKPWDVYTSNVDGGPAVQLTTQHYSTKWGPSFSGDGLRFVYGLGGLSRESLHVVSLDAPTKSGELVFRNREGLLHDSQIQTLSQSLGPASLGNHSGFGGPSA
jgi:WD40-like Beta Propeller Repeat